jgi:hypothetical protein
MSLTPTGNGRILGMGHNYRRRSSHSAKPSHGLICIRDSAYRITNGAQTVFNIYTLQKKIRHSSSTCMITDHAVFAVTVATQFTKLYILHKDLVMLDL